MKRKTFLPGIIGRISVLQKDSFSNLPFPINPPPLKGGQGGIFRIIACSFVGGISALLLAETTLANPYPTENLNPLQDLQTVDNPDPFTNGNGLGMFDLLHRSRLGINRDMNEFSVEQRQTINDEAAQFRARQQQLIQQQTSTGEGELVEESNENLSDR